MVGLFYVVGLLEATVRVDSKGRILLPKRIHEMLGIRTKQPIKVHVEGGRIVLEPLGSVTDRFFGRIKVTAWPDDLDEFLEEAFG